MLLKSTVREIMRKSRKRKTVIVRKEMMRQGRKNTIYLRKKVGRGGG